MTNTQPGRVLVTGASKGIGAAIAERFAEAKRDLVLVARKFDELEAVGKALTEKYGVSCVSFAADLSDPVAPAKLWAKLDAASLEIDVLVNNAGFGLLGGFSETPLERELEMIQVNIACLTVLTKLALRGMQKRKRGHILNVASTAGFVPGPFMSVYYATKAYVISFSEALHVELAEAGIGVTALCPGATLTHFAATAKSEGSKLFAKSNVATAREVAEVAFDAVERNRPIAIVGFQNQLMIQSLRFAPRSMVRKTTRRMQEPK